MRPTGHKPVRKKFSTAVQQVIIRQAVKKEVTTVVDGEDAQEIWPATAAWFLGPKAENLELLKSLVEKACCTFIDSLEPEPRQTGWRYFH